ncbi:hypothetical protein Q73A0000_05585 [Kaistella flava (ex Peng et al. 2021)]|uniref:Uncharacterized protein n=1 Tax=Kaistella flava (ex Peng et al. 2021) TaxID=2038776 RepID=A0A7M2Y6T3_9FLAO|nr:hypothetical protein [Kaistella flava (ex Peng et al. 2021)]QOW09871.1 hypothetical protein Q73A0000_05585 [Kaistella flava (ex Peng et al. 2021)]
MKNIGIFFLLFFLTSCNENKIIKNSIILKDPSDIYDFKNKVHSHFDIIGDGSKTRFYLTDKDWNYLEKSFIKNKIYDLKDKKIGFYTNSIDFGYALKIETKKEILTLKTEGLLSDKKGFLNDESQKYDKFVREVFSLANWRSEDSEFSKKQVDSMVKKYYSENY